MTKTEYIISILPVLYFILVGVQYWRISGQLNNLRAEVKDLHTEGQNTDKYVDELANRVNNLEDVFEEERVLEEVLEAVGGKQVPPSRN